MFRRSRRSGSGSTTLANSQRIEFGGIALLQPADPARRQHALKQPPEDAADADVHFQHVQRVARPVVMDAQGDVVDAHHFAAVDVDDLLVEQVARDAQHVLVVVVGDELLVVERDALAEVRWSGPGRSGW